MWKLHLTYNNSKNYENRNKPSMKTSDSTILKIQEIIKILCVCVCVCVYFPYQIPKKYYEIKTLWWLQKTSWCKEWNWELKNTSLSWLREKVFSVKDVGAINYKIHSKFTCNKGGHLITEILENMGSVFIRHRTQKQ